MQELDRVMKMLAARYPHIFMKLLFSGRAEVSLQAVEDTTINIPEKRSDKVFRIKIGNQQIILSLEFLLRPDQRELRQFQAKNGILSEAFRLPVITVIIYLERGRYRTFPDRYQIEAAGIRNEIIFHRILLWEYEAFIRSGELKELAPLLMLFSPTGKQEVIDEQKRLIRQIPDQQQQADLMALSAMIAYKQLKDVLIKELFYEEYHMLKQSSFVREWIDEGIQEGMKEGIKEGIKKGIKKGIKEGEKRGLRLGRIELIFAQLRRILGRIHPELEIRINQLTDEEIDKLAIDLLGIKQVSELENWLERHTNKR